MASYLDMITVLMCMFIVLFAMSSIDQEKYEALRASLATGFGQEQTEYVDDTNGIVIPPEMKDEDGTGLASPAQLELDNLAALRERIQKALQAHGVAEVATFTIDERGLTVGLVSAETFFQTNSTTLSGKAITVLSALGPVLADIPNQLSVEGHADSRSSVAPFATNWELSAGRATQVLRHIIEKQGVTATRGQAVGFGDTKPIAQGASPESLAKNRRVDIVILSDADETVRKEVAQLAGN